ncbi:MAG: XRE family transcriptional regulator [Ectothiorhodospiraceae bacterium]|nr:XRE family transcriptional regulator [Ectothiorhodospiraceae bacterium]
MSANQTDGENQTEHDRELKRLRDVYERVRAEWKSGGRQLSQSVLADRLDSTQGLISQYFTGRIPLNDTFIVRMAELLRFDPREVRPEIEVFPPWMLQGEQESGSQYEANARSAGQPTRMVPLISHVQAGRWCEATDPYPVGEGAEMVEAYGKVSDLAYAREVTGDSMVNPNGSPTFPPGAKILADPAVEWLPVRFVIARRQDDNEAIFKQLVKDGGRMYLKSLNPVYPMIPVDETITICATVTDILQQRLV